MSSNHQEALNGMVLQPISCEMKGALSHFVSFGSVLLHGPPALCIGSYTRLDTNLVEFYSALLNIVAM